MRVSKLIFYSILSGLSFASPGDNLDIFIDCNEACETKICQTSSTYRTNPFLNFEFQNVPLVLRLLLWDCPSNCDYQCQQYVTDIRVSEGEEVLQFHGKWPFKRVLLTQEFASSLFSILNFIPHYLNFQKLLPKYRRAQGSTKVLYFNVLIISIITMIAWICSTVFHIRDLLITERLDYFFAGATVLSGLHALIIRVFRYDLDPNKRVWTSRICILLYLYHFIRLNYDWSYTYNMQANITIAILQYGLFVILAYQHYLKNPSKKSLYLTPLALIGSVLFGMSFEVFDFIKLDYQIDAHAIWHLTTILPGFWLYRFFQEDIESLNYKYID